MRLLTKLLTIAWNQQNWWKIVEILSFVKSLVNDFQKQVIKTNEIKLWLMKSRIYKNDLNLQFVKTCKTMAKNN